MQLHSTAFSSAVQALLDDPNVIVLGTIPSPDVHQIPTVEAIRARADTIIVDVQPSNRDYLPQLVHEQITWMLHDAHAAVGVAQKMKLAERYLQEPQRVQFILQTDDCFEVAFKGDHGTYKIKKVSGGNPQCECKFFQSNNTCIHVMMLKMMRVH